MNIILWFKTESVVRLWVSSISGSAMKNSNRLLRVLRREIKKQHRYLFFWCINFVVCWLICCFFSSLSIGIGLCVRDYCDKFSMVYNCCRWLAMMMHHSVVVIHCEFVVRRVMVVAAVQPCIFYPNRNDTKWSTVCQRLQQQLPNHGTANV